MKTYEELLKEVHKKHTDEEWIQLQKDIDEWLLTNPPVEQKQRFYPLGYGEMVATICAGIKRKKGEEY